MKQFIRFSAVAVLFLFLGLSTSNAQEVTYSVGPAVIPVGGGNNGGFSWADLNANGYLDVFIPYNNVFFNNNGASFSAAVSTMVANIPVNPDDTGGLLADFNGDGVPDLFTTNGGTPRLGLFYNTAGVFTPATGTGDLANTGVTGEVFQGAAAAPIDHSNYLSLCWPGTFTGVSGNGNVPGGGAMWLLKGGASGFTNIARGATAANLGIDTSLSFESWDVRFFDANNDGYQDLLMPNFRNGFSRLGNSASGARKGCVLYINDGTGKFIVPTTATIPGHPTIYTLDSLVVNKAGTVDSLEYASVRGDTGIIVDDTVRHFSAIGEQFGDLNNDGIEDLVLNGLNATDNRDGNDSLKADIILYGKGDGTFTYKWDGVHVVASNGVFQATGQRSISIGDYNNDGWADILTAVTNGGTCHLDRNNGDGTFTDVASTDGIAVGAGSNRAGQFVDYNKDGFPDVFLYTANNAVLMKSGANSNTWIGFTPVGAGHNMSAIGARFTVYSGATKQIRDIRGSAGSAGQGGDLWANFGLHAANMDSMKVDWPDGITQKWTATTLAAGGTVASVVKKYWKIVEGADVPLAPPKIRPSWVAKHDTALLSKDTLSWNRVTGGTAAVTYEAQVATSTAFSPTLKDITNLTDSSTIVNLGLSTTYYWRVRAFSGGFTGAWAAVDSFKTLYTPCTTTPSRLAPLANSMTEAFKPTFKFSYVQSASTYHLQVDTLNRFAARDTGFSGGLVLNDSTTIFDTTYVSAAGNSAFSQVDSFTVIFKPAVPVLVYPAHNAANITVPVTFKWNHVAGDSNFVIQVWTYTFSGQSLTSDTTKHDTSITKTGYLNRQKYYWKVLSYNQGAASAFSAPDSFSTIIEVPGAPTLVSPRNPAKGGMKTIFTWTSALNAETYHLQVSSSNFPTSSYSEDVYTTNGDTTYTIKDTLLANTTYYWHVSGINVGGEGLFSSTAFYQTSGTVSVEAPGAQIPKEFALRQNYPNPFNPSTTIQYDLPKAAYVSLKIYDVLGRLVTTLVDGIQTANTYQVQWNASAISSGVYFYRIEARSQDGSNNFTSVKKLILMK